MLGFVVIEKIMYLYKANMPNMKQICIMPAGIQGNPFQGDGPVWRMSCLLYTSDAADE